VKNIITVILTVLLVISIIWQDLNPMTINRLA